MKILLIGDIHGNLEALQSVLGEEKDVDKVVMTGDAIGYMANPREVLDIVKNFDCILGNHDYTVLNPERLDWFNPVAKKALVWTKKQLRKEDFVFLKELPFQRSYEEEGLTVVHGCLGVDPFEYLEMDFQAKENFELMKTNLLFLGHTHVPKVWQKDRNKDIWNLAKIEYNKEMFLDKSSKYIFNIGSVGQPRDNDPRACYAIYDTEKYSICYKRKKYDIGKTVQKIIENNLPRFLFERIVVGR